MFNIKKKNKDESIRISNNTDNKKSKYSQLQINAMLEEYKTVDVDNWSNIAAGTHVRYIKKDGKFVTGGFVVNHWVNEHGKKFIHLSNGFIQNKNYITWPMAHENVMKLYAKRKKDNPNVEILNKRVRDIMKSINNIVSVVKKQEKKIEKLENQNKQLLKMLNGI